MRDPNGPIPGFEDEYYGTVRHEKKYHQNSFLQPGVKLVCHRNGDRKTFAGVRYVWLNGRWIPNVKNAKSRRGAPEVKYGKEST